MNSIIDEHAKGHQWWLLVAKIPHCLQYLAGLSQILAIGLGPDSPVLDTHARDTVVKAKPSEIGTSF